jgi:hypothetical protein
LQGKSAPGTKAQEPSEQDRTWLEDLDNMLVDHAYRTFFNKQLSESGGLSGAAFVQNAMGEAVVVPRATISATDPSVDVMEQAKHVPLWDGTVGPVSSALLMRWSVLHHVRAPARVAQRFCSLSRTYVWAGLQRDVLVRRVEELHASRLDGLLGVFELERLALALERVHDRLLEELSRVRELFGFHEEGHARETQKQLAVNVSLFRWVRELPLWQNHAPRQPIEVCGE